MIEDDALIRYIRVFSELGSQMKYATQKRIMLEVALIKMCRPQMEAKDDSLLERIRAMEEKLENGIPQSAVREVVYADREAHKEVKEKPKLERALKEEVREVVSNFRSISAEASGMLRTYLKQAKLSVGSQDQLIIVLPDELGASVVGSEDHKREIRELIEQKTGRTVDIEVRKMDEGRRFDDCFVDIEKVVNMEITIED